MGALDDPTKGNPYGLDILTMSPEIALQSQYQFDGKVLLFPISGRGNCSIKMSKLVGWGRGYLTGDRLEGWKDLGSDWSGAWTRDWQTIGRLK